MMEITNIPAEKEIFTAKTDEGYVGCFRTGNGIFISLEVFPKALVAANAARKLRKEFNSHDAYDPKEDVTLGNGTSKAKNKKATTHSSPKVSFNPKLYTHDEVETMPLLHFKEVWVITRYEDYISDALNHDKKRLVAYCQSKEQAKPFEDHEIAKRTMRTLKGTVGPGFNLQRFFIKQE